MQILPAKPVARNGMEGFLQTLKSNAKKAFFQIYGDNVIYRTLLTEPQGKLEMAVSSQRSAISGWGCKPRLADIYSP